MAKWYSLLMVFAWAMISLALAPLLGAWGTVVAGLVVTAGLIAFVQSDVRGSDTADTAAVTSCVLTIIDLIIVVVQESRRHPWIGIAAVIGAGVLLVLGATLVIRRRRSPAARQQRAESEAAFQAALAREDYSDERVVKAMRKAARKRQKAARKSGKYSAAGDLSRRQYDAMRSMADTAYRSAHQLMNGGSPADRASVIAKLRKPMPKLPAEVPGFAIRRINSQYPATPVRELAVALLNEAADTPSQPT